MNRQANNSNNQNNPNNSNKIKLGNGEKEEDFYRELDKKSLHQSCCTCQTLAVFFVGLLLVFSGTVFFLYWQITRGGGLKFNVSQTVTIKDLENKLTNVKPDASGQYQLVLSSDELNAALTEGLSVSDFILKDMVSSFSPNEILIYGNLIKPLNSKIVMTVLPEAKNGKLILTVTKITAGNINLIPVFNKQASESLNSLMDKKLASFYQVAAVSSVDMVSNELILIGKTRSE